jgi:RNA polymerase sigma-70 factor (ECF subfamily)
MEGSMMDLKAEHRDFMERYECISAQAERFCLYLVRNRLEAKEIMAETVALLYEHRHKISRDKKAFLSYALTIIRRLFYAQKRRTGKLSFLDPSDLQEIPVPYADPAIRADIELLEKCIAELPGNLRETLVLAELLELSHREIAAMQDISIANVKIRVFRAKKMLKEMMNTDFFRAALTAMLWLALVHKGGIV